MALDRIKYPDFGLSDDFGLLLENKMLSDVTLLSSGREFQAHKVILAGNDVFLDFFSVVS